MHFVRFEETECKCLCVVLRYDHLPFVVRYSTSCLLAHLLSFAFEIQLWSQGGYAWFIKQLDRSVRTYGRPDSCNFYTCHLSLIRQILILDSILLENQNRKHMIYILFENQCKNMFLGAIRLYLKLKTWFVVNCTMMFLNVSVINFFYYNLLR